MKSTFGRSFQFQTKAARCLGTVARCAEFPQQHATPGLRDITMGRYLLLWLLGIPLPILLLIWVFGGLH